MIVDKTDYLDKMEDLLNDTRKFGKINLKNDGTWGCPVSQAKWVDNILKSLMHLIVYLRKQGDLKTS